MHQTSKETVWLDESGMQIPYNRLTKLEKSKEVTSNRLLNKAISINNSLKLFKEEVKEQCEKIYRMAMDEMNSKGSGKGNFTWFNFDRSVKVEVSISERIEFDDLQIEACKEKLNEFLDDNIDGKVDFVKQLVNDAFSTSRGKLDTKKVMSLLKYRSKIKAKMFQDALDLLELSIRHPESKTYFRIWLRTEDGSYQNVDLNFSSI